MTGEVDPERMGGQVYPSLVALLKASSQHFSTNIGKQVCVYIYMYMYTYVHANSLEKGCALIYTCTCIHVHMYNVQSQEYVYVEESDVGGREAGEGGVTEVPLHDIAEAAEQQTPKNDKKPQTNTK